MIKLEFKQQGSAYVAQYVSFGAATIEMERTGAGQITVSANLQGMQPVVIATLEGTENNVIFNVAGPSGCEVTIESASEVTAANML